MAKLYAGAKIQTLRHELELTQGEMARRIDISTSYLNQLENDQRPLTVSVLLQLTHAFQLSTTFFSPDEDQRVVNELSELLPDVPQPKLHEFAQRFPDIANSLRALPSPETTDSEHPHALVREFFQNHKNYFHELDVAAEQLAAHAANRQLRLTRLAATFDREYGIQVRFNQYAHGPRSTLQHDQREIRLRTGLTESQQCFELAYHYGRTAFAELIDEYVRDTFDESTQPEPVQLAHHGLAQYFAAAVTMPYAELLQAAEETRYDIDVISARFGTGFESTCQRLATLQRPGAEAIPFVFVRTDRAGNISKRQSSTAFHFSRHGGGCPLWVVHRAFETSNRVTRQVAVMPDGRTYLWIARMVQGPVVGFDSPRREHAVVLGCDIAFAQRMIYADGLNISPESATKIGPGCATCPRTSCPQRAFPGPPSSSPSASPDQT